MDILELEDECRSQTTNSSQSLEKIKRDVIPCGFPVLDHHLYLLDVELKQRVEASSKQGI